MTITRDHLEKECTLRFAAHYDGRDKDGKWFMDRHDCVQHPRLSRFVKAWRRGTSHGSQQMVTWEVDGAPVADLNAAAAALNVSPVLTGIEQLALATVTDEYVDLRKSRYLTELISLARKGMVEWASGKVRSRAQS